MVKLSELKIVLDQGGGYSILVGDVWHNLEPRNIRLEDLILKKDCELCPREVMERCIVLYDVSERGAFCEVNADAVRQAKFSEAPCPQIGELYEQYQRKYSKPVEVTPEAKLAPEPAPKSVIDRVKENLKLW